MNNSLPDITSKTNSTIEHRLNWVGMENIAIPIKIQNSAREIQTVTANVGVFVSLDDDKAKGIHMSRLYLLANDKLANNLMTENEINTLLESLVNSQQGLSHQAKLTIAFDFVFEKPSLKSQLTGFQSYPITLTSEYDGADYSHQLAIDVPYSSTCPCSASLSRQAMADKIDSLFDDELNKNDLINWLQSQQGTVATAHSQRSFAYVNLTLKPNWPAFQSIIELLESALVTALQTAVKREDEQAFAKLNAENLMFCEDAARRLKACLNTYPHIERYNFKIEHQESLHAHNAVVYVDNTIQN